MADFAENYSMVVQDAVQRWHWTKQQCTVHPIVIYYKDSQENLAVQSIAFFQMIWNTTPDLCIKYRNWFVITFNFHCDQTLDQMALDQIDS